MIFQEMSLVPTLTVAQNIFLTHEIKTGSASSTTGAAAAARAKLFASSASISTRRRGLGDLRPGSGS